MIKFPFGPRSKDDSGALPSKAFAAYCDAELERLRDAGGSFDEARFQEAVDLALSRLRAAEGEEGA